jgi:hypothetical protein
MATTIQYWGNVNYQEKPVTGRLVLWTRGQKQDVPDDIATLLLAAGAGFTRDLDNSGEVAVYAQDTSGNVIGLVGPGGYPILSPSNTVARKWRIALAKAMAGTQNAKLAFVGDSTTASMTGVTVLSFQNTIASTVSKILNKSLFTTNNNCTFGDFLRNNPANGYATVDPRFGGAGLAAWTQTAFATAGGCSFGNSTTTTTLAFTPLESFDQIDVYSLDNTGGYGQWTINVDGGASLGTVDNNGTRAIRKSSFSVALGAHTINIQRNGTGGQVYIFGIVTRNSTAKAIDIFNLGCGSSDTAFWAGSTPGTGPSNAITTYAPDLTVIDLGINDRRLINYSSTFDTNLQAVVTAAKTSGDVLLCVPVPSDLAYSAYTTTANIGAYNDAIYRIAAANNCQVFNKETLFQSYTLGQAGGLYIDQLHPNGPGYGVIGQQLAQAIMTL